MESEKIPHQKVTHLFTSSVKCSHCILKNSKSHFSAVNHLENLHLQLNKFSEHEKFYVYFFHCWEIVYCGRPKNSQNDLMYAPVATKHRSISVSHLQRMHPTFSKSVRSLLWCQNLVIPTLFSVMLVLKSTGSITEKCYWCRNCYQRSAALLEMCLSSSKTMHQLIALMTWSSFCAMRHRVD